MKFNELPNPDRWPAVRALSIPWWLGGAWTARYVVQHPWARWVILWPLIRWHELKDWLTGRDGGE